MNVNHRLRAIMRAPALALALAAAPLFALGGCAALEALENPPRVSLVNIKPIQIQILEQRYLATLRIQNPNAAELTIDGLDYAISINGSAFADGVSNQRVTVPAYGEGTLEVMVNSTLVNLIEQLRRFEASGGIVTYGITGTLGIAGIPGGVPFERNGEIDFHLEPPTRGRAI